MNPSLIGSIAVIIWGFSIPICRLVQDEIGALAYIGIVFLCSGTLAFIREQPLRQMNAAHWRHPGLYGRWCFFVLHEALVICAIGLVALENLPLVILLNYLWPTAIILCSIAIAGLVVHRPLPFIAGMIIVLGSLSYELLGGIELGRNLFSRWTDCAAYLLTVVGALSWGLYCALTRRSGEMSGAGVPVPLFQLTLGMALPLAFLPPFHTPWNLSKVGALVLVANCIAQFIAYSAWDHGMRKGNVVVLSLFADFIPWLSLLGASLVLNVHIGLHTVLSAVMLVGGALLTRYGTVKGS